MGILTRFLGRNVRVQIENCRNSLSPTLCLFLFKQYAKQHDRELASKLAAAVTNELFGLPPSNDIGRAFLATNKPLVETALEGIKNEPRLCNIVSVFVHMLANVAGNTGTFSEDMLIHGARLRELGILLPINQIKLPATPEELVKQAQEFEKWVSSL